MGDEKHVWIISDRANIALDQLAEHLKTQLGKIVRTPSGALMLLSANEAKRIYFDAVKRVLSEGGFQESHDGRFVLVKCSACGRTETLAAKITRYRCKCDPHRDRFTFQDVVTNPDSATETKRDESEF